MSGLASFLRAVDLDELLRARRLVSSLTPDEVSMLESVLRNWSNVQSVANLLFHPGLIPAPLRFGAIDRGLHSYEQPYLALAATVGLQQVNPDEIPASTREEWVRVLLGMIESRSVLASRASVSIFTILRDLDVGTLLSRYPVRDETASKNIIAFVLSRFGDLSPEDFIERLTLAASAPLHPVFEEAHREYQRRKREDGRASLMKTPLLGYIPNLSQVSFSSHEQ